MVHHPDEVWVRYGFSTDEPWKKVNIRRHRHQSKDAQQIQATPLKKVKKEAVIKQFLTSMFFHTSHTNESQNTRVTYFPKYRCATVSANLAATLKCFSKGLIDFHY